MLPLRFAVSKQAVTNLNDMQRNDVCSQLAGKVPNLATQIEIPT